MHELVLRVCRCTFVIRCGDGRTAELVRDGFGGLLAAGRDAADALRRYRVERDVSGTFSVHVDDTVEAVRDEDALLFLLDKDITIALQHARRELYFLHAGTVARNNRALVFPASSGVGKSTLMLALAAGEFEYLSDELAPIDLRSLAVEPYPHAVSLKIGTTAHTLPPGARRIGTRVHVPVESLRGGVRRAAVPVRAVVFPRRNGRVRDRRDGGLTPISAASAAARLMAHSLNSLAHPDGGLDAAVRLSQLLPCYELDTSDLAASATSIRTLL